MPIPTDLATPRSYLGLVNYYAKFVPQPYDLKAPQTNYCVKILNFGGQENAELDVVEHPIQYYHLTDIQNWWRSQNFIAITLADSYHPAHNRSECCCCS